MKKKIIIGSILTFLIVLIVGGYFVGDYFTQYAIGRKPVDLIDDKSPTYVQSEKEILAREIAKEEVEQLINNHLTKEVRIDSFDHESLYAKIFENDSNKWVIIVHGYTSSHLDILDIAAKFYEQGYNVLTPDLRAHNESSGEYISMGYFDAIDIVDWTKYINDNYDDVQIVLHGSSMGAATVMISAGDKDLPNNVVAIVEDSGYTNAYQMFVEQLDYRFGLPSFPILNISSAVAEMKAGYNLRDASPIDALQQSNVPILFTHGDADGFVLPYMLEELYHSYSGEKEKMIIKGADHTAGRYLESEYYYQTMFKFLNKYVK